MSGKEYQEMFWKQKPAGKRNGGWTRATWNTNPEITCNITGK